MQERGNLAAKAIYEKCVPAFFYRPQQNDCMYVFLKKVNLMITAEVNDQQIFLVDRKVEELKGEEAISWG